MVGPIIIGASKAAVLSMANYLKAYHAKHGSYPVELSDVEMIDEIDYSPRDNNRLPLDGHNSRLPFEYKSDGNTYELRSYGADRKRGGEGFYSDIVATESAVPGMQAMEVAGRPTLAQFALELETAPVKRGAVMTGIFSAITTLVMLKRSTNSSMTIMGVFLTFVATLVVASFMVILHVPSNH